MRGANAGKSPSVFKRDRGDGGGRHHLNDAMCLVSSGFELVGVLHLQPLVSFPLEDVVFLDQVDGFCVNFVVRRVLQKMKDEHLNSK